jgi:hypothetical protein
LEGLVANGAKVYITALPEKDLDDAVKELSMLGQQSGGEVVGYELQTR